MKRCALITILLGLAACGEPAETPPTSEPAPNSSEPNEAVMAKWSRSCALCHVDGTGGAPRVGVPEEWGARLAQGEDTLLAHTIDGYNNMPPLGYCMSCSGDELRTLIRYMSGMSDERAAERS
jgi:cytochrome c5